MVRWSTKLSIQVSAIRLPDDAMKKSCKKPRIYEAELESSFDLVLKEAEDLYQSEGRLKKTYGRLTKCLNEMGVSYTLIGGYALIFHGVRRFTEDIDLLVSKEGLDRLHKGLIGRGYVQAAPGSRNLRDVDTGVQIEFTVSETHEGVKVIDLKSLIELKLVSGMTAKSRLQDLADVQRLIERHHLTAGFAEHLNPYVRNKFIELLS